MSKQEKEVKRRLEEEEQKEEKEEKHYIGLAPTKNDMYTCRKCGKVMSGTQFYVYRDGSKVEMCKKCLTMHIDNFDESTYLWLLEKLDVPYIPWEWNSLRDRAFAKNPARMNGMSVFGKYLSKMKLNQYKKYHWADSELAQRELRPEVFNPPEPIDPEFEAQMREKLEAGEISEAEYKTLTSTVTQYQEQPFVPPPDIPTPAPVPSPPPVPTPPPPNIAESAEYAAMSTFYDENKYVKQEELPDPSTELTEDDKIYLAMKWGRLYKPEEWVELEKKYNEMQKSFDIQDADTEGRLILICKTYLKMNQALDCGDVDGYQKLSRVFDSLSKAAKFTAAQNKEKDSSFVSSVGELVNYCEREGGIIPKFEIDEPLDLVDKIIDDMKNYTRSLIYSDTTLANQIEDYLKRRSLLDERRAEKAANGGEDLEVRDEDYEKHRDNVNADLESDKKVYNEQ